jgi:hypothetical protein
MRKRVHFSLAGVVVLVSTAVLAGFGLAGWVGINRCSVRMDAAWSRLDNGYRHRLNMTRNLLLLEGPCRGEKGKALDEVIAAVSGLDHFDEFPVLPTNGDRFEHYMAAQSRLDTSLTLFFPMAGDGNGDVQQQRAGLAGLQSGIDECRAQFESRVEEYNQSLCGIPGAWVARFGRYHPRSCPPLDGQDSLR